MSNVATNAKRRHVVMKMKNFPNEFTPRNKSELNGAEPTRFRIFNTRACSRVEKYQQDCQSSRNLPRRHPRGIPQCLVMVLHKTNRSGTSNKSTNSFFFHLPQLPQGGAGIEQ